MDAREQRVSVTHETWIDWLRILCMIWIILFHFCDYTSIRMSDVALSPNWGVLALAKLGGGIGNCTFALISGYLLYERRFRPSRLAVLWLEVMFYSCISFLISVATHTYEWGSIPELVRNFIPITGIRYWYATVYFFIYLIHPLLDIVIRQISKKEHIALIMILIYFCSFLPTISGAQTMSSGGGVEIFILMYFLGALIRKYNPFSGGVFRYAVCLMLCVLLMCASEIVLKGLHYENYAYFVWPMKQAPVILASFLLFITVKNAGWKTGRIFRACGQSAFGVYLIHIGTMHRLIFEKVFDIAWMWEKAYFAPMLFVYAVVLFSVCILCDRLRIYCLEKPVLIFMNKIRLRKENDLK